MFSEYGQYSLTFKNLKSCSFPLENWEKWIFIETTKSQWFGPRSVKVCETAHGLPTMMKSLTCKRVSHDACTCTLKDLKTKFLIKTNTKTWEKIYQIKFFKFFIKWCKMGTKLVKCTSVFSFIRLSVVTRSFIWLEFMIHLVQTRWKNM